MLTQNLTFCCEMWITVPKPICRNRERCINLYQRILLIWYHGINQSCSSTRSFISKKKVCTNSNGDKSVCLVSQIHWIYLTCNKLVLPPIPEVPKCSLSTSPPLSLLSTLVDPKKSECVNIFFIVSIDMIGFMKGTKRYECIFCGKVCVCALLCALSWCVL